MTTSAREYNTDPVLHYAGSDSEITLRIFVAMVLESIEELNKADDGTREIRGNFCFIGLDL
jgi:hypothetical protein